MDGTGVPLDQPVESGTPARRPVDPTALAGRRCYVGLDLSTTTDLTAAVAVFPDDDGVGFAVLPQFFVPQDRIADARHAGPRPV